MTEYRVLLFAQIREEARQESLPIALPTNATVSDLRKALMERLPKSASLICQSMIAVDEAYASDNVCLKEKSRIACIPPVSGG
jgi:sulfur-carrier protein